MDSFSAALQIYNLCKVLYRNKECNLSSTDNWKLHMSKLESEYPIRSALLLYFIILGGIFLGRVAGIFLFDMEISRDTVLRDFFSSLGGVLAIYLFKKAKSE